MSALDDFGFNAATSCDAVTGMDLGFSCRPPEVSMSVVAQAVDYGREIARARIGAVEGESLIKEPTRRYGLAG